MPNEQGTVVVIEDDSNIADLVDMYLRREGFRVIQAGTGEAGLAAIERERPRMAILDIGLPGGIDGMEVCQQLRAKHSLPVLMLTARDSELDRVLGLELGADDYVTKPFSPRELVARVKAILRRSDGATGRSEVLMAGRVEVDLVRREARLDGEVVPLASKEFQLLQFLAERPGRALSRQQLLDGVWGPVGTEMTALLMPTCASYEKSSATPYLSAPSGAWATVSGKGNLCADA